MSIRLARRQFYGRERKQICGALIGRAPAVSRTLLVSGGHWGSGDKGMLSCEAVFGK